MKAFEKRDIVEIAEELGLELALHEHVERPYLLGLCPFHDNTKTPAFVIYPSIQRWYCYGCTPEGGDVIDLVMRAKNLSFVEAKAIASIELSPEESLLRELRTSKQSSGVDYWYLRERAAKVLEPPRRLNFQRAVKLLNEVDRYITEGQPLRADMLLGEYGF